MALGAPSLHGVRPFSLAGHPTCLNKASLRYCSECQPSNDGFSNAPEYSQAYSLSRLKTGQTHILFLDGASPLAFSGPI
jgi:hypothetical protein